MMFFYVSLLTSFVIITCGKYFDLRNTIMFRRQARLRNEFVYKKSLEEIERKKREKRDCIRRALESDGPIPTSLAKDAVDIQKSLAWDDDGGDDVMDDEYRWGMVEDPKVVITTSRDPSSKLKQFAKEIKLIFPNSQRINRGNYEEKHLMESCQANNVTDVLIVHEHRGSPDGLIISHLPFGPTTYFTLSNVVMRHDIPGLGNMSEEFPHLIFDKFSSNLGTRVKTILQHLFPVCKADSHRTMSFVNQNDAIFFRHHTFKQVEGRMLLSEVGPRFEMKLYKIIRGPMHEKRIADEEFQLRSFTNTAVKRRYLEAV